MIKRDQVPLADKIREARGKLAKGDRPQFVAVEIESWPELAVFEMLDTFIFDLAHDVNTNMADMTSWLDTLAKRIAPNVKQDIAVQVSPDLESMTCLACGAKFATMLELSFGSEHHRHILSICKACARTLKSKLSEAIFCKTKSKLSGRIKDQLTLACQYCGSTTVCECVKVNAPSIESQHHD